jgi:hypothetical protein
MSPYPADKVISRHDNFEGNADKYLEWMLTSLIPHCEKLLKVDNPCSVTKVILSSTVLVDNMHIADKSHICILTIDTS